MALVAAALEPALLSGVYVREDGIHKAAPEPSVSIGSTWTAALGK